MLTYLAEITAYDPAISGTRTLYFSTVGYTSHPADTPAHQHYESRLLQPGLMRRDIFSQGATGGASNTGFGVIELINTGELDALLDYGFDGRAFRILLGDSKAALSSFATVLQGTMEQAEFTLTRITLRIKDRLAELDKTCQPNLYAGDNALPDGLEGTADDLKDKPKPVLLGIAYNIRPPVVNTSKLIYQVSDGPVSIAYVYEGGVQIPYDVGSNYASEADMMDNAPAAGHWRAWPTGGYIRFGSAPAGQITVDARGVIAGTYDRPGSILMALALRSGTVASGDVALADVLALDALPEVGIWLSNGENIKEAMDQIANSVGAWYGFDRTNQLRMAQLTEPSGTPIATFTADDIMSLERVATSDTGRGVPAYKVSLNYHKNYSPVTQAPLTDVPADYRAWLTSPNKTASAADASVQAAHPLAPALEFDTLILATADASAEASRRLDLYKVRRDRLNVRVRIVPGFSAELDLGDVVAIDIARFGYGGGKLFRIIGIQADFKAGAYDLTLWG